MSWIIFPACRQWIRCRINLLVVFVNNDNFFVCAFGNNSDIAQTCSNNNVGADCRNACIRVKCYVCCIKFNDICACNVILNDIIAACINISIFTAAEWNSIVAAAAWNYVVAFTAFYWIFMIVACNYNAACNFACVNIFNACCSIVINAQIQIFGSAWRSNFSFLAVEFPAFGRERVGNRIDLLLVSVHNCNFFTFAF